MAHAHSLIGYNAFSFKIAKAEVWRESYLFQLKQIYIALKLNFWELLQVFGYNEKLLQSTKELTYFSSKLKEQVFTKISLRDLDKIKLFFPK